MTEAYIHVSSQKTRKSIRSIASLEEAERGATVVLSSQGLWKRGIREPYAFKPVRTLVYTSVGDGVYGDGRKIRSDW